MAKKVAKTAATMKAPMKKAAATMKAEKASMKATKAKKADITVAVAQTLSRAYNENIDISLHSKKLTGFLIGDLAEAGLTIKKVSMKATNAKKVDITIAVAQTLNRAYNLKIDICKGASYPKVTGFLMGNLAKAGLTIVRL